MKTNQIMQRPFNGINLQQRTSDSYFCATDLLQLHNETKGSTKKELKNFISNKDTKEFMATLCERLKGGQSLPFYLPSELLQVGRGRGNKTRMHPYLFMKFAMRLNKEFEVQIIIRVHDNLIMNRHIVGDNYKLMYDTIMQNYMKIRGEKPNFLIYIEEANYINELAGVDRGSRNDLSEEKLALINAIEKANINYINKGMSTENRKMKLRDFVLGLS